MPLSETAKLLRDQSQGMRIVCILPGFEGQQVKYDPGYNKRHPKPWVITGTGFRCSGSGCISVDRGKSE